MPTPKFVGLSVLAIALAFFLPAFLYGLVTGERGQPDWLLSLRTIAVLTTIGAVIVATFRRRGMWESPSTARVVVMSVLAVALAFFLPTFLYVAISGGDTVPTWLATVTMLLVVLTIVGVFVAVIDRRRA